jgi:hypothetical protein
MITAALKPSAAIPIWNRGSSGSPAAVARPSATPQPSATSNGTIRNENISRIPPMKIA